MSEQASSPETPVLPDIEFIVDADGHVMDRMADLLPYVENDGLKEHFLKTSNVVRDIYSVTRASPRIDSSLYGFDVPTANRDAVDMADPDVDNLRDTLRNMADFGIHHSVLSPSINLAIGTVNNDRYAVELSNAYNRWIEAEFLDGDDLTPTILATPQKPTVTADTIDDIGDENVAGVAMPTTGNLIGPGNEWYDPMYESAEDQGLPIVFHGAANASSQDFPLQYKRHETIAENHLLTHSFSQMDTLTQVMFQGLPERFPDLDFVFQEAGILWAPYMKWRLDDYYLEFSDQIPYPRELPSEYMADRFYFTTQPVGHAPNPQYLAWAIEMAGPDSVMYSADLPHSDFDPPEELFNQIAPYFDVDTLRGIMGETARSVYGLGR